MRSINRLAKTLLIVTLTLGTGSIRAQQDRPDDPAGRENARLKSSARQGQLRASQVIGMAVRNEQNEDLGKVQDLIVDFDSGAVPYAIIAHGGALGIGRTKTAVPMSALQCSPTETGTLLLPATKEQLRAAARTPTGAWAEIADAEWARSVDGFYGQPFIAGQQRFERQPQTGSLQQRLPVRTPSSEQKGAELLLKPSDVTLNQQVYSAIEQELPAQMAQNIQVSIQDGVVSLRGVVDTQQQKQDIDSSVRAISGVQDVQNYLAVRNP
jgi:sporulation protein YlmC with PRC-barrel domain